MPSLDHLATERAGLGDNALTNAYVLKMIETMRGYHDHALGQTEKNKRRFNVRVRQPLEFVEYEVGQLYLCEPEGLCLRSNPLTRRRRGRLPRSYWSDYGEDQSGAVRGGDRREEGARSRCEHEALLAEDGTTGVL
jgi:hypothetical protein